MENYSVDEIVNRFKDFIIAVKNKQKLSFSNVRPLDEANDNSIVWINPDNSKKQSLAIGTRARIIICDDSLDEGDLKDKCIIVTKNPRLLFLRIVKHFFEKKIAFEIHPTAVIHPLAKIHKNVAIGPLTYIDECEIGEGTIIHGRCYIYDNVKIGKNVIIQSGTVIGSDGFGYQKNEIGVMEKFPHVGGVIIGDNVEIGANTCIDRGTLGNTEIKNNAKIDNLVHVAHNVVIGENAVVIALAMIGGSTKVGDNAWISPSVAIRDGLKIGNGSTVGMGAVVTKNVESNEVWAGNPAMPIEQLKVMLKKFKSE